LLAGDICSRLRRYRRECGLCASPTMAGRMYSKRTTQGVRTPIVEAWEKVGQAGEGGEARRGRGEGLDSWQGSEEEWMTLVLHEQLDGRDGDPEGASRR